MIDLKTSGQWLTPSEAGRVLGLSPVRVKQLVGEGALANAMKTPLGWLIAKSDVILLAAERERRRQRVVGSVA
jgi:hypothetical protein